MNEERKNLLIEKCKSEIRRYSHLVKTFDPNEGEEMDEYQQNIQDWNDIICVNTMALASMTAEPEYNTSYGEDVHLDVKKAAYDRCHPDYRWISYPAPPVTVIKPVKKPKTQDAHGFPEPAHIINSRWIESIREAGYEVQE